MRILDSYTVKLYLSLEFGLKESLLVMLKNGTLRLTIRIIETASS